MTLLAESDRVWFKEEVSELQKVFLQVGVSFFLNYFDSK